MKNSRQSPINIDSSEFKKTGYALIDRIADFLDVIDEKPVTTGESPAQIQSVLGRVPLPENGSSASELMARATDLLMQHSLLNGHPKFMGYITSSAAPVGALSDLLAAAINPNVGANILSPMATAIEKQTISWLAAFIGVPEQYGGILVSGGNMANFTAFLAARQTKAPAAFKENGLANTEGDMVLYCSKTTHTWIEKAVVLFGLGKQAIRWIATGPDLKMDITKLKEAIDSDIQQGKKPFMVVGTAGDVSTGVVDDLQAIAVICKKYKLWFHVDGAYGIPAAVVPEQQYLFEGITEADSIAMDPHKWLYSPLEAGCTLVKNPDCLKDTYSSHPVYYNFSTEESLTQNFYEFGLQNSRGFRALKVWIALQHAGKNGYIQMIRDDISLSILFYQLAAAHPELEAITQHLSITTLRYIPQETGITGDNKESFLNTLNEALLNELQTGGEVFLSNAVVNDKYCLRGCIVNFRTSQKDIEEIIDIIVKAGRKVYSRIMQHTLESSTGS